MVKHYSKGLIFSLLVCAAPIVQAETVSVEDAKGLAAEFSRQVPWTGCRQQTLSNSHTLTPAVARTNRSTMYSMPATDMDS